jgi:hypothetical protein
VEGVKLAYGATVSATQTTILASCLPAICGMDDGTSGCPVVCIDFRPELAGAIAAKYRNAGIFFDCFESQYPGYACHAIIAAYGAKQVT